MACKLLILRPKKFHSDTLLRISTVCTALHSAFGPGQLAYVGWNQPKEGRPCAS